MGDRVPSSVSPWFIDSNLQSVELRAALSTLLAPSSGAPMQVEGGVLPNPTNAWLAVTAAGTTSAPQVQVAGGKCAIPYTAQYGYEATFPATITVDLAAPPGTNPRVDLVVARVFGGIETGDGSLAGAYIETIDGSPAASPVAPAVPANAIPLAEARVNTNGTVVVTDRRTYTRATGGIRKSDNNPDAPGAWPSDLRIDAAGNLEAWVVGVWRTIASPATWSQWAPQLFYTGGTGGTVNLGSTGTAIGRYSLVGKRLDVAYTFTTGGTGINFGYGTIYTTLPPGLLSRTTSETHLPVFVFATTAAGADAGAWDGMTFVPPNSNQMIPRVTRSQTDARIGDMRNATASGAVGTGLPQLSGQLTFPGPNAVISINGVLEVQ